MLDRERQVTEHLGDDARVLAGERRHAPLQVLQRLRAGEYVDLYRFGYSRPSWVP